VSRLFQNFCLAKFKLRVRILQKSALGNDFLINYSTISARVILYSKFGGELTFENDVSVHDVFLLSCSVLQCVAVCCSVLQSIEGCCSVLQCAAVCCSVRTIENVYLSMTRFSYAAVSCSL